MTVEELHAAYQKAFRDFMQLAQSLPIRRSKEQEARLHAAEQACTAAKWRYEKAKFWTEYVSHQRGVA